jgi:hypothetical protein
MFACHFLTDLFAAGHIRTPRKEILNYVIGTKGGGSSNFNISDNPDLTQVFTIDIVIAGLWGKMMHDEDSSNGIYVKIKKDAATGEERDPDENLEASGDGNFYRKSNHAYAVIVCQTVVLALKDLFLAYNHNLESTVLDKELLSYIPREDVDENLRMHNRPLFARNGDSISYNGVEKMIDCVYSNVG